MKKQYIKPQAETLFLEAQALMANTGHDMNKPDAKEQFFEEEGVEEENLPDYVGAIKFRNVWDEDDS